MNKFDQFVKHKLKEKYYIRYADDFIFMAGDKEELVRLVPQIAVFLSGELGLILHPDKLYTKTLASGLDFLGWVHFPDHRVLRASTKRRVIKALNLSENLARLRSYWGLLKHGNQNQLKG